MTDRWSGGSRRLSFFAWYSASSMAVSSLVSDANHSPQDSSKLLIYPDNFPASFYQEIICSISALRPAIEYPLQDTPRQALRYPQRPDTTKGIIEMISSKYTTLVPGFAAIALASVSSPALADNYEVEDIHVENAEACFQQTVLLNQGADPASLDVAVCDQALYTGPQPHYHRSAMLHNRALIHAARGELQRARTGLEAAVKLADEIGPQHLALAQVAAKQGDYHRAAELYALMLSDNVRHPLITENRDVIERNLDRLSIETGVAATSE